MDSPRFRSRSGGREWRGMHKWMYPSLVYSCFFVDILQFLLSVGFSFFPFLGERPVFLSKRWKPFGISYNHFLQGFEKWGRLDYIFGNICTYSGRFTLWEDGTILLMIHERGGKHLSLGYITCTHACSRTLIRSHLHIPIVATDRKSVV